MRKKNIALIGLGYVGLPLAVEFGKKRTVIGFDTNKNRIDQLKKGIDLTMETSSKELKEATNLTFTTNIEDIKNCAIYIVTVPTPIDKKKKPRFKSFKKCEQNNR
jgi:UDP-N-acetyl-D-galactosamine dehydrogenase